MIGAELKKPKPMTETQKKAKTEAVATEINAVLEKHGCILSINRWIDTDGRIQAGMAIAVKE